MQPLTQLSFRLHPSPRLPYPPTDHEHYCELGGGDDTYELSYGQCGLLDLLRDASNAPMVHVAKEGRQAVFVVPDHSEEGELSTKLRHFVTINLEPHDICAQPATFRLLGWCSCDLHIQGLMSSFFGEGAGLVDGGAAVELFLRDMKPKLCNHVRNFAAALDLGAIGDITTGEKLFSFTDCAGLEFSATSASPTHFGDSSDGEAEGRVYAPAVLSRCWVMGEECYAGEAGSCCEAVRAPPQNFTEGQSGSPQCERARPLLGDSPASRPAV